MIARHGRVRKDKIYKARDPQIERGLVLQRHVGQKIRIGDDIEVTLLATEGPSAQIHIHAPINVRIDRDEVARGTRSR